MIGFGLLILLAAAPPKGARPMTQAEEESEAIKKWEGKEGKAIQIPDAGVVPPFRWKLSNIVRETPIDGIQMINDTPVKLHSVLVKGRLEDVMIEIHAHFLASGLFMVPIEQQSQPFRQLQITALDQTRALSYTAMIDALADGTCLVMLGEANIGESTRADLRRKALNLPVQDFAPLMPLATSPTRVSIEGMKTLSFQVKGAEADVRKFYRSELKKLGYTEGQPDLFQKGVEEIQLSTSRDKELLNVLLTLRGRLDDPLRAAP